MTKEEIINAIVNFDIIHIEDIQGYEVFDKESAASDEAILSVCPNGVVVTFLDPYKGYAYSLTPFDDIKSITYLTIKTIE